MIRIFLDALDLARFRVRPVDTYAYPWWQPVSMLTLVGVLPALTTRFSAPDGGASPIPFGVLLFGLGVLTWLQAVTQAHFYGWWLRQGGRWRGGASLFPLIVGLATIQLLALPLSMLPDTIRPLLALGFMAYQLVLLPVALSRATGVALGHVLAGLLLYALAAMVLMMIVLQIALGVGWISLPPELAAGAAR
jgi:hypothetical protein